MNSITELLDLEDTDIIVSDVHIEGTEKTLTLETPPTAHYCPCCGFRMHSALFLSKDDVAAQILIADMKQMKSSGSSAKANEPPRPLICSSFWLSKTCLNQLLQ